MYKKTKKLILLVLVLLMFLNIVSCKNENMEENTLFEKFSSATIKTNKNSKNNNSKKNPINFKKLQNANKDAYAWIKIKNTNINYPILSTKNQNDDNFYLRKNIYKKYDTQGCIFTQRYNNTDWTDRVTVVYGHNIWTRGTMFYQLHKFENKDFFNKNKNIIIYTEKSKIIYEIYSVFEYKNEHIMQSFNFNDDKEFLKFITISLKPVSKIKNIRKNYKVSIKDRLIVLNTCIKNKENLRFLVVGKFIKEDFFKNN